MNETKWRLHWRKADGSVEYSFTQNQQTIRETVDQWNKTRREAIHWLQPDGTEPALKQGTGAIRWRLYWLRPGESQPARAQYTWSDRDEAQGGSDLWNEHIPETVHWIQPEPADAVAEKPEPTWAIHADSGMSLSPSISGGWKNLASAGYHAGRVASDNLGKWVKIVEEAPRAESKLSSPPQLNIDSPANGFPIYSWMNAWGGINWDASLEPKPEPLWQVWHKNVRGTSDKNPALTHCWSSLSRAKAEEIATRYNLEQQKSTGQWEWRYWAEPVKEEVKVEPPKWHVTHSGPFGRHPVDGSAGTEQQCREWESKWTRDAPVNFSIYRAEPIPIPDPPKPYERRWKFMGVTKQKSGEYTAGFHSPGAVCHACETDFLMSAARGAQDLMDMAPQKADAEIDRIYAGQK